MKRILPFLIVAVVGGLDLTGAALLYRAKRPIALVVQPGAAEAGIERNPARNIRGNPKAPVTLEEFGDYQCPPCRVLSEPISRLEKDLQPNLRVVFRHFPLATHSHSREAALAAEAAAMQGHFWEMHDLLYKEQPEWSKATDVRELFKGYAGTLKLDVDRFEKDMRGEKAEALVAADQQQGTSIGVQNTPTIFLNNRAIDPQQMNPPLLRATVEEAIKAKTAPAG